MKVDKMSLSFPADLGDEVRLAAKRAHMSVSAWVADAAAAKLRSEALRTVLDEYQAEHGSFTTAELAEAERALGFGSDPASDVA